VFDRNRWPRILPYALTHRFEAADLVTEMTEVKHPFQAGIRAQKGIEF
jgi:ATP:corrinoid adenosyltransferase